MIVTMQHRQHAFYLKILKYAVVYFLTSVIINCNNENLLKYLSYFELQHQNNSSNKL